MVIRTKILATVGPACGTSAALEELIRAGCDAFRINFSHGDEAQHEEFVSAVRSAEAAGGEPVALCADLCGPKIRVGLMVGGGVLLAQGQSILVRRDPVEGDATQISTSLPELIDTVAVGDSILLDDGRIRMTVTETAAPDSFACQVVQGGVLGSGKGVHAPSVNLPVRTLTEKDRRDAAWLAGRGFDYVALSFVRKASDIHDLRALLDELDCEAQIIAKIETLPAVENIASILQAADAVMVARGDLGVEMDLPAVPVAQKRIAAAAQAAGKPCIVATEMLQSMIEQATPTRVEVSDIANAVLDHADAVMLSGETAVGKYPLATVDIMNRTVWATQDYDDEISRPLAFSATDATDEAALASAVRNLVDHESVSAVAVFTTTGQTARWLSRMRPSVPILALCPEESIVRRMCLYYGVIPVRIETPANPNESLQLASTQAKELSLSQPGEKIVVLLDSSPRPPGKPNTLVVHPITK